MMNPKLLLAKCPPSNNQADPILNNNQHPSIKALRRNQCQLNVIKKTIHAHNIRIYFNKSLFSVYLQLGMKWPLFLVI